MRHLLCCLCLLLFASIAMGCAGTIPVNYVPQNFVRVSGSANVGEFAYQPFTEGKVKRPNQIQNTAIGQIYLGTNIADLVRRATALELEKSGVVLDESCGYTVKGNVLVFKANDLGYSVDWTYAVNYTIIQDADGKALLSKDYVAPERKTGKFGLAADYGPTVNEVILSGYDLFIRDPETQKILGQRLKK